MFKKQTYFYYSALFILLLIAVVVRFYEYKVDRNFLIFSFIECDPTTNDCFVENCSPQVDSECNPSPYAKIAIPGYIAPECLAEHTCESFVCSQENGCIIDYCTEEVTEEWETCSSLVF